MKTICIALLCAGGVLLCAAATADGAIGTVDANIDNFSFGPAELTVSVGTKVTWTNRDDIPHTVVEVETRRSFKSSALDTGDQFAYVFNKVGTFHYICSVHPFMHGTVIVK
jgi:plastocyanin